MSRKSAHQRALEKLIQGWTDYATAHESWFAARLAERDGIGQAWESCGRAIADLLDGEAGSLNKSKTLRLIDLSLKAEGFEGLS